MFEQIKVRSEEETPIEEFLQTAGFFVQPVTEGVLRAGRSGELPVFLSTTETSLYFEGEDLKPWSNLSDVVVVVYHSWTTSRHCIKSLDTQQRLVQFTAPSGWPMGYWEKNQRPSFTAGTTVVQSGPSAFRQPAMGAAPLITGFSPG